MMYERIAVTGAAGLIGSAVVRNLTQYNNIEVIYTIYPVKNTNVYDYIDKECFKENKITKILVSYELQNCDEING